VSLKGRGGIETGKRLYALMVVGDGKVFVDTYDRFRRHGGEANLPIKRVKT
jgi:hypothetical protein